jgi:hypothetical protein
VIGWVKIKGRVGRIGVRMGEMRMKVEWGWVYILGMKNA